VFEPDVSPLAVQGPRADDLMAAVVGEHVRDIRFFRFIECEIAGAPVILARSGWSGQGGFEIYLQDASRGEALWDCIWEAGQAFDIRAGCPNLIERLESGLMSYGSDMTVENNPLECGLGRFLKLDKEAEYLARDALQGIAAEGVRRKLVRLMFPGAAMPSPRSTYTVLDGDDNEVGIVTSLAWSPRHGANLSFATIETGHAAVGTSLYIVVNGERREGEVRNNQWQ
jgi:dimethylsulfoniopropionate demethylase